MRKRVEDLFLGIPILERIHWDPNRLLNKVTSDSRAVQPGDVFVACSGACMDGHDFIGQAIHGKAAIVVYEREPDVMIPPHVTGIRVKDSRVALALILRRFYDAPDRKIKMVGVTGTNGKTTTAYLLYRLLREQVKIAYLGTLFYELPSGRKPALNTTPGPETLLPMLAGMVAEGVQYCAMECSSHAIHQNRIRGLEFEMGIFTQLTQDHLDYHGSMERYFQTKRQFFVDDPPPRRLLLNKDCPYGRRMIEELPRASTFSVLAPADYYVENLKMSLTGSTFDLCFHREKLPFQIRMPMRYNVSNVLAVLAAIDLLGQGENTGFRIEDFRGILEEIPPIPGRMERAGSGTDFSVFVDYAHTPDAIEQVLRDAKSANPKRILTVFGCGGDRDKAKRQLMVKNACQYSDVVIMTSDNPRTESPEEILLDMRKGLPRPAPSHLGIYEIIDRAEAIEKAVSLAKAGDAVFILGKGHEDYQILGDVRIPFNDREVVESAIRRKSRVALS
ncbi:MAG: UDP-N-acetylmuramoyl-L-alanyl-D-glutamate--L-lysine ligase [Candidatus Omnitrophica bacterium ADurb.Bin292]|nr:MAG: UDP-N-acetylmuramoyl-L-alanyl-D-glutamate--L-lysine ligase [Candidatus Omnitrophica bacterium ADurb.Bin292]